MRRRHLSPRDGAEPLVHSVKDGRANILAGLNCKEAFEHDKHAQSLALLCLLQETAFAFADRKAVLAALSLFEAGSCGLADGLVVAKQTSHRPT